MARLTVSYSIAFIPGLPRPLVLSEVVDDVIGLSTFTSRHAVRKSPGTPDRLDIIVPLSDLDSALDSAAKAADELTRIGESLLGLGFVVEERAIRIDGLTDNWLPDTFDGAGTRHHASTHLDAAAPLPDHLDEPTGDVPDEDLRLDNFSQLPAADQPFRPFTGPDHDAPSPPDDLFVPPVIGDEAEDPFAPLSEAHGDPAVLPGDSDGPITPREGDGRFAAPRATDDMAMGRGEEQRFSSPRNATVPAPDDDDAALEDDASGDPRGEDPFSVDPLGTRALRGAPRHDGDDDARARHPTLLLAPIDDPPLHRREPAAVARRRDLVRLVAVAPPDTRATDRKALALFAIALAAAIAPWRLGVSAAAIGALALIAAGIVGGATALWPSARGLTSRTAITGAATLAVVLAFASAYAICAREGDLHSTRGPRAPTVGQSLSAAVSLGAAPGLSLGPGARSVAYGERLLLLLALTGLAGAQMARTRTTRRRR